MIPGKSSCKPGFRFKPRSGLKDYVFKGIAGTIRMIELVAFFNIN